MRRVPSQLHPCHCDRLRGRAKGCRAAQLGVNDLVHVCKETGDGGDARAGALGQGLGKGNKGWLFSDSEVRSREYHCRGGRG